LFNQLPLNAAREFTVSKDLIFESVPHYFDLILGHLGLQTCHLLLAALPHLLRSQVLVINHFLKLQLSIRLLMTLEDRLQVLQLLLLDLIHHSQLIVYF
jgi:hypothetical protein